MWEFVILNSLVLSMFNLFHNRRDFPGSPVVKTSPSNAGVGVQSLVRELRSPPASRPNIKQKQYCNKFNKDFKNGPHPKNLKKNFHNRKVFRNQKCIVKGSIDILEKFCEIEDERKMAYGNELPALN